MDELQNTLKDKAELALMAVYQYANEFEKYSVTRKHLEETMKRIELHIEILEKVEKKGNKT